MALHTFKGKIFFFVCLCFLLNFLYFTPLVAIFNLTDTLLVEADLIETSAINRITLMGDDEEVLVMDLLTLYFTLQNLTTEDFFKLR